MNNEPLDCIAKTKGILVIKAARLFLLLVLGSLVPFSSTVPDSCDYTILNKSYPIQAIRNTESKIAQSVTRSI